jgi:hypothetical protein
MWFAAIELCPALVFLVFLHMFFNTAWLFIKPWSIVLNVFSILQNEHSNVLLI